MLQNGRNLGPLRNRGFSPGLSVGPAMLTDRAPQDVLIRTARPKGHLAVLVALNGVPQLSVGGSNRRQTYLLRGGQERDGFAR